MHAPAAKICDTCGSSLDLETPSGFCPACLLSTALNDSDEEANGAGASIADYEILSEIARGGMGIVYRARQRVPDRVVALKMILPAHISSGRAVARFRAEAEAAASLDHPGILPVYAVGEKDGAPFYSMKFAEGGSLANRLSAFSDKPRESAELISKLSRAVAHAHERGILHRDIKPGNVLFDGTDNPFVSDFGLAKWLERECDLTQTLAILGTPFYMAPEQASGAGRLTLTADIYSLGAILFHLLTGRVPFRGNNAIDVLRQAAEWPAPRPRTLNRKVQPDLDTICLKCLEKNPTARYSSATALADDLDRFLARRAIFARRATPLTHSWRWVRRNPLIAGLSAASVALSVSLVLISQSAPSSITQKAEKSIAVLPFENLSDDKENAYFASGIQDALLTRLSKIADLKVISRTSTEQFKSAPTNIREIAQQLGVANILEGSVQREGEQVRISVQLINATSDSHLWTETYDRKWSDALQLESEIAERVTGALAVKLAGGERHEIATLDTANPQAYDLYLHGLALQRSDPDDIDGSIRFYRKAVELDPNFALAWAKLGCRESDTLPEAGTQKAEHLARAQTAVDTALRLRPDLGEAHTAAGLLYYEQRDLAHALIEFAEARTRSPNDSEVPFFISLVKRRQGKWDEAIELQRQALNLDPLNFEIRVNLARSYRSLRKFPEARDAADRALAVKAGNPDALWMKAELCSAEGDLDQAEQLVESTPNDHIPMVGGSLLFGRYIPLCISRQKFEQAIARISTELKGKNTLPPEMVAVENARIAQIKFYAGNLPVTRPLLEQARRELKAGRTVFPVRYTLIETDALLGLHDEVQQEAEAFLQMTQDDLYAGPIASEVAARGYAILGDAERAIPLLQHALSVPYFEAITPACLRFDPAWDRIRGNPRFQELLVTPPHAATGSR